MLCDTEYGMAASTLWLVGHERRTSQDFTVHSLAFFRRTVVDRKQYKCKALRSCYGSGGPICKYEIRLLHAVNENIFSSKTTGL